MPLTTCRRYAAPTKPVKTKIDQWSFPGYTKIFVLFLLGIRRGIRQEVMRIINGGFDSHMRTKLSTSVIQDISYGAIGC